MTQAQNKRTQNRILCALFAALTAVCAQIAIPLPFTPVQITLATFAVLLSGALLGAKNGALCQCVYLLCGAVGLPVFTRFSCGFGILFGATGGYLLAYPFAAFLVGSLCNSLRRFRFGTLLALLCGNLFCYALGTLYYSLFAKVSIVGAVLSCVLPFLPGDILKIAAAFFLSKKLTKSLPNHFSEKSSQKG